MAKYEMFIRDDSLREKLVAGIEGYDRSRHGVAMANDTICPVVFSCLSSHGGEDIYAEDGRVFVVLGEGVDAVDVESALEEKMREKTRKVGNVCLLFVGD